MFGKGVIKYIRFYMYSFVELDIIEGEDGVQGLYWCVDYPWPMSDRDVSLPVGRCVCTCV